MSVNDRRGKLGVEGAKGLVTTGPVGVRMAKDPSSPDKRDAGALRFLPRAMLAELHAFGDALLRKRDAVVELQDRWHLQAEPLSPSGPG